MAIRRATVAGLVNPILCGAALRNKGVHPLLDAVLDYLPSPFEVPAVSGTNPKNGETITREPSEDEPFAALAFKVVADPYVGRLVYFRVYSGVAKQGAMLYNAARGTARAPRADSSHAREPAGGYRQHRGGADRGDGGPQAHLHGRHALRRVAADRARGDQVPGAGHLRRDRAEDEGRPGAHGREPDAAGRGRPDVQGALRQGDRPDDHLRHGRAAPRDHRRPHAARVQRRGARREAGGRVTRSRSGVPRAPRAASSSRPAVAGSSVSSISKSSRCRTRASSCSRTRSSAARSRKSSSRLSSRA